MSMYKQTAGLVLLLVIAATGVFGVPADVRAQGTGAVTVVNNTSPSALATKQSSWITSVKSALTAANTAATKAADIAQYINTYVLQPLAFVEAGKLTQALTAAAVGFVIGKANGTGIPQFVVDLQQTQQTVADSQTLATLNQIANSDMTYKDALEAELGKNYEQSTTLGGYWAANMDMLRRTSPNPNAFLNGNWTQGGTAAWLALTTDVSTNPYMMYQQTKEELTTQIGPGTGGATGARAQQLVQGQGFTGWCGPTQSSSGNTVNSSKSTASPSYSSIFSGSTITVNGNGDQVVSCTACSSGASCSSHGYDCSKQVTGCTTAGGTVTTIGSDTSTITCHLPTTSSQTGAVHSGDPCIQPDGTPGVIKTPGSVIAATLNKAMGAKQDQVVRMGNVGPEINNIIGSIEKVIKTAKIASTLLGGNDNIGGLLGAAASAPGSRSLLDQISQASGGLGVVGTSTIAAGVAQDSIVNGSDISTRVSNYLDAWTTIRQTAKTASSTVANLQAACVVTANIQAVRAVQQAVSDGLLSNTNTAANSVSTLYNANPTDLTEMASPNITLATTNFMNSAGGTGLPSNAVTSIQTTIFEAASAVYALTNEIAPVLSQADQAAITAASTTAALRNLQVQLAAGNTDQIGTIQNLPPSDSDVVQAQQDAQASGAAASTTPTGSLTFATDGSTSISLVDKMNTLTRNAAALHTTVCNQGVTAPAGTSSAGYCALTAAQCAADGGIYNDSTKICAFSDFTTSDQIGTSACLKYSGTYYAPNTGIVTSTSYCELGNMGMYADKPLVTLAGNTINLCDVYGQYSVQSSSGNGRVCVIQATMPTSTQPTNTLVGGAWGGTPLGYSVTVNDTTGAKSTYPFYPVTVFGMEGSSCSMGGYTMTATDGSTCIQKLGGTYFSNLGVCVASSGGL